MIVDFSKLELNKESPIYLQLIRYVKIEIVAGNVENGDEMPSRRVLSTMLSVNPNTVQKAYRQMEDEGLLISFAGSKSLITFNDLRRNEIRKELIQLETMNFIQSVKGMGFQLDQAKDLIDEFWIMDAKGGDGIVTI